MAKEKQKKPRILSPDDPWPQHSKTWFQDAYQVARAYRWSCQPHSSHTGSAKFRCPTGACEYNVYGTGFAGEDAAKDFIKKIQRCTHGGEPTSLQRASELMDAAERLLDAVDRLLRAQNLNATAEGLLFNDPIVTDSEIDGLWREADRLTEEASSELGDLRPDEAVQSVSNDLSEARTLLRKTRQSRKVDAAKARLRALRQRCNALKKLIAESQVDS